MLVIRSWRSWGRGNLRNESGGLSQGTGDQGAWWGVSVWSELLHHTDYLRASRFQIASTLSGGRIPAWKHKPRLGVKKTGINKELVETIFLLGSCGVERFPLTLLLPLLEPDREPLVSDDSWVMRTPQTSSRSSFLLLAPVFLFERTGIEGSFYRMP